MQTFHKVLSALLEDRLVAKVIIIIIGVSIHVCVAYFSFSFSVYPFLNIVYLISGRGNHAWLSPEGCAMFSLQISIPMKSILGRHLTFVQHLASMAIVEGVKSIPDYEVRKIRRTIWI